MALLPEEYKLIPRIRNELTPLYRIVADLVDRHHHHLRTARISVVWHTDPALPPREIDSFATVHMRSLLDRVLDGRHEVPDCAIVLRLMLWKVLDLADDTVAKEFLLDRALCCIRESVDKKGNQLCDVIGRAYWACDLSPGRQLPLVDRYDVAKIARRLEKHHRAIKTALKKQEQSSE